jgi:ketosteroid isomerase-like protein
MEVAMAETGDDTSPTVRAERPADGVPEPSKVVEAFGAAWAAHDLAAALAMVSDDCVFDATGPAPDGTRHVGVDALRRAWAPIFDDPGSHFYAEETFGAGDRVVQRWRYSFEGGHVRGVDLFLVRDGKVAEKLSYVKG